MVRHVRLPPGPGIDLLLEVVPIDNILFASEMLGAVRGVDPETGHHYDDTRRYIEAADLTDGERQQHLRDERPPGLPPPGRLARSLRAITAAAVRIPRSAVGGLDHAGELGPLLVGGQGVALDRAGEAALRAEAELVERT